MNEATDGQLLRAAEIFEQHLIDTGHRNRVWMQRDGIDAMRAALASVLATSRGWLPIEQWPERKYGHAIIYDPRWGVTEGMRFDGGTWGLATFNGQVMQANPTHFYAPGLPAPPSSSASLSNTQGDGATHNTQTVEQKS